MSDIHQRTLNQIGKRLKQLFDGHIDMSDVPANAAGDETHFLSRALAALYIRRVSGLPLDQVGQYITDGGNDGQGDDGGIDAIYYQPAKQTLFLVQSKWRNNPGKSLALADWKRFRDGVLQIISADMAGLNKKTLKLKSQIEAALNAFETKIQCVILNASHTKLSTQITKDSDKFQKEQNQYTDEFVSVDFLDLPGAGRTEYFRIGLVSSICKVKVRRKGVPACRNMEDTRADWKTFSHASRPTPLPPNSNLLAESDVLNDFQFRSFRPIPLS